MITPANLLMAKAAMQNSVPYTEGGKQFGIVMILLRKHFTDMQTTTLANIILTGQLRLALLFLLQSKKCLALQKG